MCDHVQANHHKARRPGTGLDLCYCVLGGFELDALFLISEVRQKRRPEPWTAAYESRLSQSHSRPQNYRRQVSRSLLPHCILRRFFKQIPAALSVSEFVTHPTTRCSMNNQYDSMEDLLAWDDWLQTEQSDW